ncbi:Uncharacterised protein [uncultured archaeon]|nr:Uncharacterised protein [uncultured archaeon]
MKLLTVNHKLRDIIVYFTYKTRYLTEIRLVKMIYLAELCAIERLGKRLTDIEFKSYFYGPYSDEIATTGQAISGEDIVMEYKETNKGLYATFFKTTKDKTCVEHLNDEEFEVLEQVARDWGFKPTKSIVMATKESEPYKETEFGDMIDLDKYKKDMDSTYRNEKLLTSVKQSMLEVQQGKGVLCATAEDIDSYLDSL